MWVRIELFKYKKQEDVQGFQACSKVESKGFLVELKLVHPTKDHYLSNLGSYLVKFI